MGLRWKRTKAFFLSITFFLLALLSVFALVFGIKYICNISDDANMPIYSVDTDEKKIAITFDVAWGSENIDEILEVLDKHNIKATFFLVGSWIDDNKNTVKLISEKGHEIGNHSNTHPNMKETPDEDIMNEIEITSEKISNITGQRVTLFRPPFGEVTDEVMEVCKSLDYTVIKWDVDSLDWKGISADQITERVYKSVQPGSIVLFHASSSNVKEYLDTAITQLEKNGYGICKVSDLIYKDNYTINSSGVQKSKEN
ncbi:MULTISPECIES: polysaccharide deacetylase family protein [unclassified Romboutsia]|uniref:polysaccharide deacetylase family protein n=1 Tax=unclassified Romboutsia TaxID=2626894 RepID=UPI00082072CF|nr:MULTISPECIES: polysaccharide deacetylase family protein [unclassified Romboutsia]SCI19719.1 Probable polysaccharide deacetylase pdaA precursor [uncultured Clostridium sp.]